MSANRLKFGGWIAVALLGLVEVAAIGACAAILLESARAQVLDDRFPFLENRQRRYQQQQQYQQWNQQQWNQQQDPWGTEPRRQRSEPVESARAPAPRRLEGTPTTNVMVFGDSMAEWLAYGLEEAFAETPEVGIVRKPRQNTGLIRVETRGEAYDWPQSAREMLAAEKPDYVVMMLGIADRRGIREALKQPARPPAGQKQADQAKQPQGAQPGQPAAPAAPAGQQAAQPAPASPAQPQPDAKKPTDAEAPPQQQEAAREPETPAVMAPEGGAIAGTVVREFRSDEWGELYGRRVDEMFAVLKARGVPVFWVGLPPVRGARATSEMVYLNDIYRARAEKAGIGYIDIWDGFVDESGNYNNYGPDYEGQTRRLRAGDGANFTRAGARKLAHYVERELRRVMQAKLTPSAATPTPDPEPEVEKTPAAPAAPGLPPRPTASPVMSLTAPRGAGDALLGGAPVRNTTADSVATRVLVKGEPIEAPAGRADDFTWPRRDIVTATGVLPPDPVEPPPKVEAVATAPATTPAGTPAPAKQAAAPRRERRVEQQQQPQGWQAWGQPWGQQRPEQRRQDQGFFGWFGGNRW